MSSYSNQEWIIDTGANDHVIFNFSCLNSPISCASNTSFAKNCQNGDSAPVTHIGLALVSENTTTQCSLCSHFKFNLLSISKFIKESFDPHLCLFQEQWNGKMMRIGKEKHGLYLSCFSDQGICCCSSNKLISCFSS